MMRHSNACSACGEKLNTLFLDLGVSPLANHYLSEDELCAQEIFFPLKLYVCDHCLLVQTNVQISPDVLFQDYAYFSSYSSSWVAHAERYVEMMCDKYQYGADNKILEIASNDGYLLQHFVKRDIQVLGVDPAENVVEVANQQGVPSEAAFFTLEFAQSLLDREYRPDLIIANNVLAHVPNIKDFVSGCALLLDGANIMTVEAPHLLKLMEETQFDTVYHEHFYYYSLHAFQNLMESHGLTVFDVEQCETHGGSLRYFVARQGQCPISSSVTEMFEIECAKGLDLIETYHHFGVQVNTIKRNILSFLIEAKKNNKTVVAYGAAAKGNTLLNYCGIGVDFLDYVVDANVHKQSHYLPGTHIPIYSPDLIAASKPDYLFILPWNIKNEIMEDMSHIAEWGGEFVIAIPELEVIRP